MPNTIESIPIRLQCSSVSNPPVQPVDISTGAPPQAWRAIDLAVAMAVFDVNNVCVDLENLDYVQLIVKQTSAPSDPILILKTVEAADIIPTVSIEDWRIGENQQAIFNITAAELDLNLAGLDNRQFWIVIQGFTTLGAKLTYGAGYFYVYSAGGALPTPSSSTNSYEAITNTTGDSVITPTTGNHTAVVTLGGIARTSVFNILAASRVQGDRCIVRFIMDDPSVSNIIIDPRNATTDGDELLPESQFPNQTFATDGYVVSLTWEFVFNGSVWEFIRSNIPS